MGKGLAFGDIISKMLWDSFCMGCPASEELSSLNKTHSRSQVTAQKRAPHGSLPRIQWRQQSTHWVWVAVRSSAICPWNHPSPVYASRTRSSGIITLQEQPLTATCPPWSRWPESCVESGKVCPSFCLDFSLFQPYHTYQSSVGLDQGLNEGLCVTSNCTPS